MGMFCVAGAVIGLAAKTWDWSRGVTFGVAVAAIAIIGLVATREAAFAPAPTKRLQTQPKK